MNPVTSTFSGISETDIPFDPSSIDPAGGPEDPVLPPRRGAFAPAGIEAFAGAVRAAGLLVGVDLPCGDCVKAVLDALKTSAEPGAAAETHPDSALAALRAALEGAG